MEHTQKFQAKDAVEFKTDDILLDTQCTAKKRARHGLEVILCNILSLFLFLSLHFSSSHCKTGLKQKNKQIPRNRTH